MRQKICACTNVFAKPSESTRGRTPRRGCQAPAKPWQMVCCAYFTMRQKCVLAQTFLQSRHLRSRAKRGQRAAVRFCRFGKIPAHSITQTAPYRNTRHTSFFIFSGISPKKADSPKQYPQILILTQFLFRMKKTVDESAKRIYNKKYMILLRRQTCGEKPITHSSGKVPYDYCMQFFV